MNNLREKKLTSNIIMEILNINFILIVIHILIHVRQKHSEMSDKQKLYPN